MISSGQPVKEYIDSAVRHVLLRQVSLTKFMLLVVVCALFGQISLHYLFRTFASIFLSIFCDSGSYEVSNCHSGGAWYQGQDHA